MSQSKPETLLWVTKMAATGKTPILLYGSTTATNQPSAGNLTNSSDGCEIAINVADKNLFFKDSTNAVNTVPIRQSSASSNGWLSSTDWSTFNGKAPSVTYTTNYIPYGQGTTTPAQSANLTFDGSNTLTSGSGGTGATSSALVLKGSNASGQGSYVQGTRNGSGSWILGDSGPIIGGTNGLLLFAYGSQNTIFWSADYGKQMEVAPTTGNVTLSTGNLVIGTSGKGIDFSATPGTGTSELLADYEEGTWTANYYTGANGTGTLITSVTGNTYTKVGRAVFISFYRGNNGTGNALSFTGLPYTISGPASGITADSVVLYSDGSNTLMNYRGTGEGTFSRGSFLYIT